METDDPPTVIDGPRNNPLRSDTCGRCTHYLGRKTCVAFPGGIPEEIWSAYLGHREPFPGDRGVQFKQIPIPTSPAEIPDFLRKKPVQP